MTTAEKIAERLMKAVEDSTSDALLHAQDIMKAGEAALLDAGLREAVEALEQHADGRHDPCSCANILAKLTGKEAE